MKIRVMELLNEIKTLILGKVNERWLTLKSGVRISQCPLLRNPRLPSGFLFFYRYVKVFILNHCMTSIIEKRITLWRIPSLIQSFISAKVVDIPRLVGGRYTKVKLIKAKKSSLWFLN